MVSANSKIFVTLTGQGSPIKTKALLDSGNNTDFRVVISEKIHNELKASFVKSAHLNIMSSRAEF